MAPVRWRPLRPTDCGEMMKSIARSPVGLSPSGTSDQQFQPTLPNLRINQGATLNRAITGGRRRSVPRPDRVARRCCSRADSGPTGQSGDRAPESTLAPAAQPRPAGAVSDDAPQPRGRAACSPWSQGGSRASPRLTPAKAGGSLERLLETAAVGTAHGVVDRTTECGMRNRRF